MKHEEDPNEFLSFQMQKNINEPYLTAISLVSQQQTISGQ
jgi:hypothetical protein